MNEITQKNTDFMTIYNRSYRLAAAVFMISNIMDKDEELRTKMKKLSLELVSTSVDLKDISFLDAKKLISNLEKISLELMSVLDIASIADLVSKMNAGILREEFQSFVSDLSKFSDNSESNKNISIKSIFSEPLTSSTGSNLQIADIKHQSEIDGIHKNEQKNTIVSSKGNGGENHNGHKRKDLRKNTILEFIKGHNNTSIKDIVPNITGCSGKTVQRELISLINEGKIRRIGERRWSRYSIL